MNVSVRYLDPLNGSDINIVQRVEDLYATGADEIRITELGKSYTSDSASKILLMLDVLAFFKEEVDAKYAGKSGRVDVNKSAYSRVKVFFLCLCLGFLGAHRLYVRRFGTGFAQMATLGGLGVWVLIDFILIIAKKFKDNEGRTI